MRIGVTERVDRPNGTARRKSEPYRSPTDAPRPFECNMTVSRPDDGVGAAKPSTPVQSRRCRRAIPAVVFSGTKTKTNNVCRYIFRHSKQQRFRSTLSIR